MTQERDSWLNVSQPTLDASSDPVMIFLGVLYTSDTNYEYAETRPLIKHANKRLNQKHTRETRCDILVWLWRRDFS